MEGVRRAEPQDADRCFEMYLLALAELDTRRGGTLMARQATGARPVTAPSDVELAAGADDPDLLNLVGTYEGAVVGMAQGHVEQVGEGLLHGIVDAYYVEPNARGVGVGEALLRGVLDWFAVRGCVGVDALALPGDRHAKRFFEANGFKTRLLIMHREPDGNPGDGDDEEVPSADRDGADGAERSPGT